MTAPWQKTFLAFAGPGIKHPSDSMRVTDAEATAMLADLNSLGWSAPVHVGSGIHAGYAIHHAPTACTTALFGADGIVGFYAGSYLWIAHEHRGLGLSTPLILAAAEQRGGTVLPPGVVVQGFSPAGLAAHRVAHNHAVLTAIAAGLPVPAPVWAGLKHPANTGNSDGRADQHASASGGFAR